MKMFCSLADVTEKIQQYTFDDSSEPNTTEIKNFIKLASNHLRLILFGAGYDPDNLHDVSDTIALSITAGTDVSVIVTDGSQFTTKDDVLIYGLSNGIVTIDKANIKSISGDTLTLDIVTFNFEANVTLYVVNSALGFVSDLNAYGAACQTMQNAFQSISPNESNYSKSLCDKYYGSKNTQDGIWAIQNIPGLLDAVVDEEQKETNLTVSSYMAKNSTDDDLQKIAFSTKW